MSGTPTVVNDEGRSCIGAALVVSGGDGTLFHLLQKLRPPYPAVAIVPSGRGNALARDLRGLTAPVAVDLMSVEVEFASGAAFQCVCGSSVSFGHPAAITRKALRFRRLRRLSYAAATCVTLPRQQLFTIEYDGANCERKTLTGILINNTRHVGGFVAFPEGSCRDGKLDSMELSAGYVSHLAHSLSAMIGAHLWSPVRITQVREVSIRPESPQELMLDGELVPGVAAVRVRVLPGAMSCIALRNG